MPETLTAETWLPWRFFIGYAQAKLLSEGILSCGNKFPGALLARNSQLSGRIQRFLCTVSGQGAVDELHSVDFKQDRVPYFFLTLGSAGVWSHSFFDSH